MSDGSTPAEAPDPADMAAAMAAAQAAAEAEAAAQAKAEAEALAASLAALAAANAQAAPTLFHDDTVAAPRGSFGPTFPAELAAAGAAGLAYAYGPVSITFAPTISAKDRARVMAVVAAHDSTARPAVDLANYASSAHAALRDGGVTIGGMRIKTDAESRGLIDGAYALSQARPDGAIDFKAASGWVTIDAATMQTVAVSVGQWVQACYSAYRQVDDKISKGAFTTPAQVDAAFAAVTLPG